MYATVRRYEGSEQKLEDALPSTPKVTAGQVGAHQSPVAAAVANGVLSLA